MPDSEIHYDPNASTKSLLVGKHDGHADGHLNCTALRHGWTRTFSIPAEEVPTLDYETLANILEVHTLKLRPVGVRIFVENPPNSGTWSKIRMWKNDGSLQSVLVQQFFEGRLHEGIITRVEIRDGADRAAEGDTLSLKSVGSRIFHPRDRSEAGPKPPSRRNTIIGWFGTFSGKKDKGKKTASGVDANGDANPEDQQELVETPQKSLLSQPASAVRSIFSFFRPRAEPEPAPEPTPEQLAAEKKAEEENLRKRGWAPPGMRKHRSLREQLRYGGGTNPFLGNSGGSILRKRSKKDKKQDPFADPDVNGTELANAEDGPKELTEQDVDDFFEVERPESMVMTEGQQNERDGSGKPWSRFKPKEKKRSKKKGKGKATDYLGDGVDIVATPEDAFPKGPEKTDE